MLCSIVGFAVGAGNHGVARMLCSSIGLNQYEISVDDTRILRFVGMVSVFGRFM